MHTTRTRALRLSFAALIVGAALAGCAEAPPELDAPGASAWRLDVAPATTASATRDGRTIVLSEPPVVSADCGFGSCGNARAIYREIVRGDFSARFRFEGFHGNGTVSAFVAGAAAETFEHDRPVAEGQLTGFAAIPNVSVAFHGIPGQSLELAHGAEGDSGWVVITRRGNTVTVESHAGGSAVVLEKPFGAEDVILGVTLQGASEDQTALTEARFTGFSLTR